MILSARRSTTIHRPSRSQKPGIVLGLRYERRFVKALREAVRSHSDLKIEHNPWFFYEDDQDGSGACSPDVLIRKPSGLTFVIEVKYTWVPTAHGKLLRLYCPVVSKALDCEVRPLVVVKRLTAETPQPCFKLLDSSRLNGAVPVFQWLETAPLSI